MDITFGQYYPSKSPVHRLDPRVKLIFVLVYIVTIFLGTSFVGLGLCTAFLITAVIISRLPVRLFAKAIKPILPIIIFTAIINLFYAGGDPLFYIFSIAVTKQGVLTSLLVVVRIILLIAGSSMLIFTTTPTSLTDGLERLLSPLTVFRLKVHELAMMMTIALRFIPTLTEETDKIMNAQKARGADIDSGGLFKRVKALVPVFIPLLVSSFRRAFDLAVAMECRCYTGGEGRTRMKIFKLRCADYLALGIMIVLLASVIVINFVLGLV